MTKKIYSSAGHGGYDPGAVGNGLQEKDLTLKIENYMCEYLQDYDVEIKRARTNDRTVGLTARTNEANKWGADVLVDIHINAGGGTGHEDFVWNGGVRKETLVYQDDMHDALSSFYSDNGIRDRGQKQYNFHMCRESSMPAILTENLFIDTKSDAKFLSKESNLKKIGEAHAKGLIKYLDLKRLDGGSKSKVEMPNPKLKPNQNTEMVSAKFDKYESATYVPDRMVYVHAKPSIYSEKVAYYTDGQKIDYDQVWVGTGRVFVSYIGRSGNRRFVPCREIINGNRRPAWGRFIAPVKETVKKETKKQPETVQFDKYENATFIPNTIVNVRANPSVNAEIVAQYYAGEEIKYSQVYIGNGYVWVSYIGGSSGKRRYVACRSYNNGRRGNPWGRFK